MDRDPMGIDAWFVSRGSRDPPANIILGGGMNKRIERHRKFADAFYSGLSTLRLTPFGDEKGRSNVVIALNYLKGMDDKKFRSLLSEKFKVLIAGGFGSLKGQVFRIGSMGEVNKYHVMRTMSSIYSAMSMLGMQVNKEALYVAEDKLQNI